MTPPAAETHLAAARDAWGKCVADWDGPDPQMFGDEVMDTAEAYIGALEEEVEKLREQAVPAGMTALDWTESHGPRQYECSILRRVHPCPTSTTDWYVYLWYKLLDWGCVGSAIEAPDAAREAIAAAEAAAKGGED